MKCDGECLRAAERLRWKDAEQVGGGNAGLAGSASGVEGNRSVDTILGISHT